MSNAFLYVAVVLIWGSTWYAIGVQVEAAAPGVSVFYRYVAAAFLLLGWCLVSGRSLRFGLRSHLLFAGLGLTLFSVNFVLVYAAEVTIGSALTAVVFASLLWMNMLLARLLFGTALDSRTIAGSVIGMVGLVIVCLPGLRAATFDDGTLYGVLLALAGTAVASGGNMLSQHAQAANLPVVQANAWGMLYGAAISGAVAWLLGEDFAVAVTTPYLASLFYLVVFGSILGFGAYLTLLGRIGAHRAGYASVAFPVVAMILAVLFEGFDLTETTVIGGLCVLCGNLLTLSRSGAAGAGRRLPGRSLAPVVRRLLPNR